MMAHTDLTGVVDMTWVLKLNGLAGFPLLWAPPSPATTSAFAMDGGVSRFEFAKAELLGESDSRVGEEGGSGSKKLVGENGGDDSGSD